MASGTRATRRIRHWLVAVTVGAVAVTSIGVVPALGATAPSLRLEGSAPSVTLDRWPEGFVPLDLGVYVAATGGDLELKITRRNWTEPLRARQYVDGRAGRVLPDELVRGFDGLADFATVTFRTRRGAEVASTTLDFCPNAWGRQRLTDASRSATRFPPLPCGSHFPFTRGMVWGIDDGWAVGLRGDGWGDPTSGAIDVPPGRYRVTVEINPAHAAFFGIRDGHRRVRLNAVVNELPPWEEPGPEEPWPGGDEDRATGAAADEHGGHDDLAHAAAGDDPAELAARQHLLPPAQREHHMGGPGTTRSQPRPTRGAITMASAPDDAMLPDLVALPAWALSIHHDGEHEWLNFASTPWNGGPGPFVVEGFRRRGEAVMDAFQYFHDEGGTVVGRVPIGDMEYHAGGGHDHWHFLQFAAFDLLDRTGEHVLEGLKQGFCIAPTDPVDLTRRGAVMQPWSIDGSSCGGPTALWVREVLVAGWGDTYHNVEGQAFDITGLPNGTYKVRVRVDPEQRLTQQYTANDEALRTIRISGRPGERQVTALPWNGIDG